MENILIVDDEPMILEMQKRYLEEFDYQCFLAINCDDALICIEAKTISLALLDINMPGRSGVETLKEIKERYPDTVVIMVTANDDYDIAEQCLELGADDYIVKPFTQVRVLVSVRNALEKQRLFIANRASKKKMKDKLLEQEERINSSQVMLIQQEKLAAIGQLAAGVAHEINNPLGYISANLSAATKYTDKLQNYFLDLDEIHKELSAQQIEKIKLAKKKNKISLLMEDLPDLFTDSLDGTNRIKEIVQGLKCFSRTDLKMPGPVDINSCIENAITVIWNEIKYNSKIEKNLKDIPFVNGFQQQLAQVFMNLLVNASHAIEKNGIIQIKSYQKQGQVIISFSDNGCGISEENLAKIFDPFFTTKEPGKGTGLGMSIVNEIIHNHEGEITVRSTVGQGTEFLVSLPAMSHQ